MEVNYKQKFVVAMLVGASICWCWFPDGALFDTIRFRYGTSPQSLTEEASAWPPTCLDAFEYQCIEDTIPVGSFLLVELVCDGSHGLPNINDCNSHPEIP